VDGAPLLDLKLQDGSGATHDLLATYPALKVGRQRGCSGRGQGSGGTALPGWSPLPPAQPTAAAAAATTRRCRR
jgi:hypothetical protein